MNREIKFRAWHTKDKVMFNDVRYHKKWECLPYHGNLQYGKYLYEGINSCLTAWEEDVVMMQFTGLVDKNGVEIYEGDIVSDGSIVDDYGTSHRAEIVFNKGAFRYGKSNCFCGDCESVALEGECDNLLVIGNIYQHPELLTT